MKTALIAATISSIAAFASANPVENRAFQVAITFWGADGSSYGQNFPADSSSHAITNTLSVTNISSAGGGFCNFHGVDGSSTVVIGEEKVPVSPPQAQIRGSCDIL
ncbi:uncharacterized protein BO80DRAFT_388589 [Aspergillus ibericus CBS 121593]|uniref:Uncharacterized protein n=1 Tax=Aspergillus ibericus CBS 121593 TaxID=1448316 RepID=A0A395GV03_9EURO|nr:hypothetical protein BO80DRAFT_388589 [Aspergillus ibericus CBS 121593]RAK97943.1 hypothetical protein BO80DRAFT_388589 [Aspergillus ibericus CBS 121593]